MAKDNNHDDNSKKEKQENNYQNDFLKFYQFWFLKDIDPKFKFFFENSFSHDILRKKIDTLPKQEKELLEKIKTELNLKTNDDVINYLYKSLIKIGTPSDRASLSNALMKKLDNLNTISYRQEIKQFKRKCEETNSELYDLILDSLKLLWVEKYKKQEAYQIFEIAKEFENILFKDPDYRDHFIHQFQVFLSGLPILDNHYEFIKEVYSSKFDRNSEIDIEFSWLLAASFHDNGYLVQKFDKWMDSFFTEFLKIENIPTEINLHNLLTTRKFQDYIDKLTSLYSFLNTESQEKWYYGGSHKIDNEIRLILTKKLIENKNHGVISSLILLDRIENSKIAHDIPDYQERFFSSVVFPAGLSICLHDKDILTADEIKPIDFKKDPLSFILVYCDTIQEWGRPIGISHIDYNTKLLRLSNYEITDNTVSATISYDKIVTYQTKNGQKTNFECKNDELKKVFRKLRSNEITFKVTLQSSDKEYEIPETTITTLR